MRTRVNARDAQSPVPTSPVRQKPHPFPIQAKKKRKAFDAENAGEPQMRIPRPAGSGFSFGDIGIYPGDRETPVSGEVLPAPLRKKMETAFHADFSDVRVHLAAPEADSLSAKAFTQGSHMHFAPGQYDPASPEGQRIIAHELAHVVQQRKGQVPQTRQANGMAINDSHALESAADALGERAASGKPVYTSDKTPLLRADTNVREHTQTPSVSHQPAKLQVVQRYCGHEDCTDPICNDPNNHEYTQHKDPSIKGHLTTSGKYMGERAMKRQKTNQKPSGSDVRVPAVKLSYQRGGSGMHEGLPTDMRDKVKSNVGIAQQSGQRSSTDTTILGNPTTGVVGGHTGAFPKKSGRGSTHTKGQSKAHDVLRVLPDQSQSEHQQMLDSMKPFVSTLAHGQQIMQSNELEGAIPNTVGATPIGKVGDTGPGSESRIALAQRIHGRRERTKKRIGTYAKSVGLPTPMSPERTPIDDSGQGGGYLSQGQSGRPSSPIPTFGGGSDIEIMANQQAWMTAPTRHGSLSTTWTRQCQNCSNLNPQDVDYCVECGQPL